VRPDGVLLDPATFAFALVYARHARAVRGRSCWIGEGSSITSANSVHYTASRHGCIGRARILSQASVIVNVVPAPGVLATAMVPPCASLNAFGDNDPAR